MVTKALHIAGAVAAVLSLAAGARAHEHHMDDIPEGEYISVEPMDSILWTHIMFMIVSFGLIFPIGMVLGMTRSRWHVPVQVAGTVLGVLGYTLGHLHKGREFSENIHASFASFLMLMLVVQVALGAYLKLHLERGLNARLRPVIVFAHGLVGKAFPVVTWVQMGFGGITALGFCHEDHLGQCLAHGIMGSSFIAYGCILLIMLMVGQQWLARTGKSQEFFDSLIITLWGIVNTFTEHRWGSAWSHGDYQHTSMGIVWWCAGMVGLMLSSKDGQPRRNHIPAIVLIITGWAMSVHAQHLELSTKVHAMFGYALMGAGFTRIIEISFVLSDRPFGFEIQSFQFLPPWLLVSSGLIFMCATEEQLTLIAENGIDASSYLMLIYGLSFLIYLYFLTVINVWIRSSGFGGEPKPEVSGYMPSPDIEADRSRGVSNYELLHRNDTQLSD
ncbi:uncharacterized protein V1510DRAFT_423261 [Dipodascopsis tothii]|uniref:uncharacterized protein n=1 Tax=Dipodascopsis tothii TaxID=44089 RepID=UPI0034CE441C